MQEWKSKLYQVLNYKDVQLKNLETNDLKNKKQGWEFNALILYSKLLKYPKDVQLQLVVELFLNLPPLHTMQTHNSKISMLIVQFNLPLVNPKTLLYGPYVQPMLGGALLISHRT
jgi:hypothetical protein